MSETRTIVKRFLTNADITDFLHLHARPCPYCGDDMVAEFMDIGEDLLHRHPKDSLTGWVIGYSCDCTSEEQAYG